MDAAAPLGAVVRGLPPGQPAAAPRGGPVAASFPGLWGSGWSTSKVL